MKIALLILLIANFSLTKPLFKDKSQITDKFQLEIEEIKNEIKEFYKKLKEGGKSDSFTKFISDNQWVCTGGKDPSKMSKKEYLEEFSKSSCAPTLLIPGASMSKLIIKIDCPTLLEKDPETFHTCGWKDCSGGSHSPQKEYLAWIPEILSPISLLKPSDHTRTCFTNLVGFSIEGSGHNMKVQDHVGVTSLVLGESDSTRQTSHCGLDACTDLVPAEFQTKDLRYFEHWKDLWINAGYINGLTFQTLPYDWRKDFRENNVPRKFPQIIDGLFEATGKKVVIAAHSYGNFQTLSNVYKLSTSDRQEKIGRYISIAPPFLGSAVALQQQLGMSNSFEVNLILFKLGLTPKMFKNTLANFPACFNLMPSDFFVRYSNTEWMKAIKQRLQEEKDHKPITKGTIMDIFPTNDKICREAKTADKIRGIHCTTGFYIPDNYGKVVKDPISYFQIPKILSKYSYNKKIESFYTKYSFFDHPSESKNDFVFPTFPNPEIPITFLYANALNSETFIYYKNDPQTKTMHDKFYMPDSFGYALGDTTIDTTSSIMVGVKWAYEHQVSKLENSHPIGFGEICGNLNRKSQAPNEGGYFGIDCECHNHGKGCDHAGIMVDEKLIQFIFNTVKKGEDGPSGGKGVQDKFKNMSEQDLQNYVINCDLWW